MENFIFCAVVLDSEAATDLFTDRARAKPKSSYLKIAPKFEVWKS